MSLPQESPSQLLQTLQNPENRCRNNCGFHGNPQWNGYCSKCYKELASRLGGDSLPQSVRSSSSASRGRDSVGRERTGTLPAQRPSPMQFSKFESKKKSQTMKKGKVSQFFRRSQKHVDLTDGSTEGAKAVSDVNDFLKTLKKPAAQDIISQLKKFVQEVMQHSPRPVADNQRAVRKFFSDMFQRLTLSTSFKGMSEEELDKALDCMEKYIMTRLHGLLFCPSDADDERRDISLQQKMKQFRWLKTAHLGVDINLDSLPHNMRQALEDAQKELVGIDMKRSPQDKLQSIVNCSKHIFVVLHACNSGPAGADHFLPTLIYVIIQAMPPRLHSNMEYIQRFSNPVRLSSGESSYYFTNLCGAVSFIENISAETLHMTEEEFEGYLASNDLLESPGEAFSESPQTDSDPLTVLKVELEKCGLDLPTDEELQPNEDDISVPDVEQFEPLKIMRASIQAMIELNQKHEELRERALTLQAEVEAFRQSLTAEVQAILNYKRPETSQPKVEATAHPIAAEV